MFKSFSDSKICLSILLLGSATLLTGCGGSSAAVQKQLEEWVAEQKENKKLPVKVGQYRTLIDIQAGDHELIQIFRVTGISEEKFLEKKEKIYEETIKEIKKRKGEIENLITYKIKMTFKYQLPDETPLHEITIKPWEDL